MGLISLTRRGLVRGGRGVHAVASSLTPLQFFGIVAAAIVGPPVIFLAMYARRVRKRPSRRRTATVLVLGDIGRSPRMMYHAESLARAGWDTYLVGYGDTAPIPSLLETPLVHFRFLANPPRLFLRLPWILRAPIRVVYQVASVMYLCVWAIPCNTQILLVQNPPSIPTLLLAQMICNSTGSKLIIDWHNTGYSILAMRVGPQSRLVQWAEKWERSFGQKAYCHLFVTHALEEFLVKEWHLKGRTAVLHDRPPSNFRRTEVSTQLNLFRRITPTLRPPLPDGLNSKDIRHTAFTEIGPSGPQLRDDRPAFIFSSTSWTADEDFSYLLKALDDYQAVKSGGSRDLPRLVVIITGRGELRAPFEAEVARREDNDLWPDICVRCTFVSARDYPLLLGCGDLGISMHQSSSGRDLPMKVVDMFGCGLPVLARGFGCLDELVTDGVNGRIFNTPQQLGEQLVDTLEGFPAAPKLEALKSFFMPASRRNSWRRKVLRPGVEPDWSTWDENWDAVMKMSVLDFKRSALEDDQ